MSPEIQLALRKQRLLLRSAALRSELAGHVEGAAPVIAFGDHVVDGMRWLRHHPLAVAAAGGVLLAARPRGVIRWVRRGVAAWQVWRQARAWVGTRVHSIP